MKLRRRHTPAAAGAEEQETPEEAYQRRLRESQRVEERVDVIYNEQEFREQLEKARLSLSTLSSPFVSSLSWNCVPLSSARCS